MFSYYISVCIRKETAGIFFACVFFDKCRIISVGYKADILTVRFVAVDKSVLGGKSAYLFLCHFSERKNARRKLPLRKPVQHIRLVFGVTASAAVYCFFQKPSPAFFVITASDIMSGCNTLNAFFFCGVKQCAEFNKLVAFHARIGRFACKVA